MKSYEKYQKIYDSERVKLEEKFSKLLEKNEPESLYEPCRYILSSGGKRLRPFIVLMCAKAVGGKYSQAYNAALAVEIFHNFTLVHDDIMDNSDKRRGRPTLHVRNDLSTAILTGDNLIGVAYKYLLKDCTNDVKSIIEKFTTAIIEVCEGQSLDKDFEIKKNVSINEYNTMIGKKTAALLKMCCSIGAEIGGGDKRQIKALEIYGFNLGMAFQIQDDLLDLVANEVNFGKPVGSDLVEGKKNYLFLKAYKKAEGKTKEELEKVILNKGVKRNQVAKYEKIYRELNIISDTEEEIVHYTNIALKALTQIDEAERGVFEWLADYLIKRKK